MNKPFAIESALRGEPVWHTARKLYVKNLVRVGNRVAFQLEPDEEAIYYTDLEGKYVTNGVPVLEMKSKEITYFINLWDSPSFHYTKHPTEEAARSSVGQTYSGRRYKKLNSEPIAVTIEL